MSNDDESNSNRVSNAFRQMGVHSFFGGNRPPTINQDDHHPLASQIAVFKLDELAERNNIENRRMINFSSSTATSPPLLLPPPPPPPPPPPTLSTNRPTPSRNPLQLSINRDGSHHGAVKKTEIEENKPLQASQTKKKKSYNKARNPDACLEVPGTRNMPPRNQENLDPRRPIDGGSEGDYRAHGSRPPRSLQHYGINKMVKKKMPKAQAAVAARRYVYSKVPNNLANEFKLEQEKEVEMPETQISRSEFHRLATARPHSSPTILRNDHDGVVSRREARTNDDGYDDYESVGSFQASNSVVDALLQVGARHSPSSSTTSTSSKETPSFRRRSFRRSDTAVQGRKRKYSKEEEEEDEEDEKVKDTKKRTKDEDTSDSDGRVTNVGVKERVDPQAFQQAALKFCDDIERAVKKLRQTLTSSSKPAQQQHDDEDGTLLSRYYSIPPKERSDSSATAPRHCDSYSYSTAPPMYGSYNVHFPSSSLPPPPPPPPSSYHYYGRSAVPVAPVARHSSVSQHYQRHSPPPHPDSEEGIQARRRIIDSWSHGRRSPPPRPDTEEGIQARRRTVDYCSHGRLL